MRNARSCDFVLYFKVGKTPLRVIEVDGASHNTAEQAARDALKNSILAKSGLAILRLRTVESGIEEKVEAFLAAWGKRTLTWNVQRQRHDGRKSTFFCSPALLVPEVHLR
ncbi:hypothetical protein NK8_82780 (plasmid) [Caballeronia sp. NK8]|uniref:DUF2726 domain-containing protein n=1 Tax=Caballeronia sp. NK8 TaxID=140098 RepID=UPI001BB7445E|nr:DUF2726 domain-containing protein [Caballeronia sp. NK8]BCQ30087.1 hypothetical protein NK8_82780 [Caballeronia sp. NK8]